MISRNRWDLPEPFPRIQGIEYPVSSKSASDWLLVTGYFCAEAQGIEPSEPQSNPAPVLKTGEPTRRPDASIAQASEVSVGR